MFLEMDSLPHSILEKYHIGARPSPTPEHHWTNFLGIHTDTRLFLGKEQLAGQWISAIPVPDDGVYGSSIEYISMLMAIDSCLRDGRQCFTAVELGAGWGPWVSAVGIVGKRAGIGAINLVAVEADKDKVVAMERHINVNDLRHAKYALICGAAWSEDTTLYFPKQLPIDDWGAGPSSEKSEIDYRGLLYETEEIPAFSLGTICGGLDVVDFAHWDIQGAEWPVTNSSANLLNERFRSVFIGTHSRKIEGDLLGLFHSIGWEVLYHSPCDYVYDMSKPTLEGMTTADGSMLVRNPKLA